MTRTRTCIHGVNQDNESIDYLRSLPSSNSFFRHSRPLVKIKIVRMSNEKDMKELSKLLGGMNMPPGALALNFAVWTGRNEQDDARFKFKPHSSGRRLRTPF